ncbi:ribosome hibernation factor-recruiting GTPase MRF [Gordonia mangrovi]|uniref:ribosome hibernation factor-recruiting GTPase MRF n=1 Tax=Gordonia mangrovi TaxID=2665643 RepID=UPI0021AD4C04|nr:GTP-binding protein [Gordonia mangrovi]UVF77179.1 GTP-binding protein [Gordonia mangrovi]
MNDRGSAQEQGAEATSDGRTPVVLVTGLDSEVVSRVGDALTADEPGVAAGTVLVHHDLSDVSDGRVARRMSWVDPDGRRRERTVGVKLAHGCVSCTLREDLLPLLRRLHRRSAVRRIVLTLDPILEPERIAWAVAEVVVEGMPGFVDGPASRDVRIEATIACVAEQDWLESATGDTTLAEAGFGPVDDERTLAQVAVGQVAFADALVVAGCDPAMRDAWESARLTAVLKRLAPHAPIMMELPQRPATPLLVARLLAHVSPTSRRGRVDAPHDPLLRGEPPLDADCGVRWMEFHADRPMHPARLHDAIDALLDGVVTARGRIWLATQSDEALWLESAGGALQVAHGGRWLAAMSDEDINSVSLERRAMGALRWDADHGDRHTSLVALVHRADVNEIHAALRSACLNEVEFAAGQDFWATFDDPFGGFHADPCDDLDPPVGDVVDAVTIIDHIDPREA